jgi:hypothetical protein
MENDQGKYSFVKEMFIVFIIGGALGVLVLVVAEVIAQYIKML